ncbi:hypothetical protein PROFUN_16356 [Planoprotostelium fungivorum]|uniref:GRIP domain-containing protein n=1 Tax=Planoprotostelium fungivorum TaxID=1890364 RepID=A0A2P6MR61_9EUKA|nr:hypothetical protein PROFUN_16356 [Planoprotostelium fungivorum]
MRERLREMEEEKEKTRETLEQLERQVQIEKERREREEEEEEERRQSQEDRERDTKSSIEQLQVRLDESEALLSRSREDMEEKEKELEQLRREREENTSGDKERGEAVDKYREMEKRVEELEAESNRLRGEIEGEKKRGEEEKKRGEEEKKRAEEEKKRGEEEKKRAEEEKKRAEEEKKRAEEEKKRAEEEKKRAEEEKKKREETEMERDRLKEAIQRLIQDRGEDRQKLEEEKRQEMKEKEEKMREELKRDIEAVEKEREELKRDIEALKKRAEGDRATQRQLEQTVNKLTTELDNMKTENGIKIDSYNEKITKLKNLLVVANKHLAEGKKRTNDEKMKFGSLEDELQQLRSREEEGRKEREALSKEKIVMEQVISNMKAQMEKDNEEAQQHIESERQSHAKREREMSENFKMQLGERDRQLRESSSLSAEQSEERLVKNKKMYESRISEMNREFEAKLEALKEEKATLQESFEAYKVRAKESFEAYKVRAKVALGQKREVQAPSPRPSEVPDDVLEQLKSEINDVKSKNVDLHRELEKMREEASQTQNLQTEHDTLQKKNLAMRSMIQRYKEEMKKKESNYNEEVEKMRGEMQQMRDDEQLKKLEEQLRDSLKSIEELNQKLNEQRDKTSKTIYDRDTEIDSLKQSLHNQYQEMTVLKNAATAAIANDPMSISSFTQQHQVKAPLPDMPPPPTRKPDQDINDTLSSILKESHLLGETGNRERTIPKPLRSPSMTQFSINPPQNVASDDQFVRFAQMQAQRDNENDTLKTQLDELRHRMSEFEQTEKLHIEQEGLLKETIRSLERNQKREGANAEYMKNIVLKFITSTDNKETLLPVLGTVLQLNAQELSQVKEKMVEPSGVLGRWSVW